MVNSNFAMAMAMAAATPGPLGGSCRVVRRCVDYTALARSILRHNAHPELLSRSPHRSHISWMERSHLYPGDGNSSRVVLIRASGSDVAARYVGNRGHSEYCRHHWFANLGTTTC